jgi:hypothetical protein
VACLSGYIVVRYSVLGTKGTSSLSLSRLHPL